MTKYNQIPVLAVDIGGTKIMAAVVSPEGNILADNVRATYAGKGVTAVIDNICNAIEALPGMDISGIGGIGIACAGGVDTERGLVTQSPNLPDWRDVPLARILRDKYNVDTYLVNDASAAALGEHRFGAGRGVKDLVLITLGTGIGGGIVINGALYLGASGAAAEIGHMVIDINGPPCACGINGCLESLASGKAVARDAIERIKQGEESVLAGKETGGIIAEDVYNAAAGGDKLALDVLKNTAHCLGVGLLNVVNIFNPEMIILGGGMSEQQKFLIEPARQVVDSGAFRISAQAVRIVTAQLGNKAGVYGAAAYVMDRK